MRQPEMRLGWFEDIRARLASLILGPTTWRKMNWWIQDMARGLSENEWRHVQNLRRRLS